jgi:hypothetical protein
MVLQHMTFRLYVNDTVHENIGATLFMIDINNPRWLFTDFP